MESIRGLREDIRREQVLTLNMIEKARLKVEWTILLKEGNTTEENYSIMIERLK
jgi:hypothetical protein